MGGTISRETPSGARITAIGVVFLLVGLALVSPADAATYTVTNTNDIGTGSLRWSLDQANANAGPDSIHFDIPDIGPHAIQPLSALPTVTDTIVIDGYTQPGAMPATPGAAAVLKIELEGSLAGGGVDGFSISAGGCMVRGLAINRFGRHGISIETNGGNVLEGNHIGTDVSGTADLGNGQDGVYIFFVPDDTIGGTVAAARNVISGNDSAGVRIFGYFASGTVIQGNYLGTDANGADSLGNGTDGIYIWGAHSTTIGGTAPEARNLVSANGRHGIFVEGNGATGTVIQGNYIGIAITGFHKLGNGLHGIHLDGAPNTTIGGTSTDTRNIIADNGGHGVSITGVSASYNIVQGNYIGTDFTGTADFGNDSCGVTISAAPNNTVGGIAVGARNVISGNGCSGIQIDGSGASWNVVRGNYIGTDFTGTVAVQNAMHGVSTWMAPNNTIGGTTPTARNVISGNGGWGVRLDSGNYCVVQGNYIGTDVTGTTDLGNSDDGISVRARFCTIGGSSGAGNVISGNNDIGIHLVYQSDNNVVQGNYIGTDANGTADLGNVGSGIMIGAGTARYNTIGGQGPGEPNIIAYNDGDGIHLLVGYDNAFLGNSIFSNGGLGIDLDPDGVTPNDPADEDGGANHLQNFPVLTSVECSGTCTFIRGSLNSTANTVFRLEFFSNSAVDPSGHGEGESFLGSANVTTDGGGNVTFAVIVPTPVSVGQFVTATATDPSNNTSEFSEAVFVMVLSGEILAGELSLDWSSVPGTFQYWAYGAADTAYFAPGLLSPYRYRLQVLPAGTTSWSSPSGIGDPDNNWTYLIVAVDVSEQELCRTNRCGEHDFGISIP